MTFLAGLPLRAGMASGKAQRGRMTPAQMAQRPPTKRPREDALLEADRTLDEQLDGTLAEARRLACKLENTEHSQEVLEEVCEICAALRTPATRAQRAELALRWFESNITWRALGKLESQR